MSRAAATRAAVAAYRSLLAHHTAAGLASECGWGATAVPRAVRAVTAPRWATAGWPRALTTTLPSRDGGPAAAAAPVQRTVAAVADTAVDTTRSPPSPPPPPQPTADLCDFALSELDAARSVAESATRTTTYKPQSFAHRVGATLKAVATGSTSLLATITATPGRVLHFFTSTTRAERKATYAGWWSQAKAEARHYWAGLKLLGADVRIAARLVRAAANGRALTRRERRQLTRTMADMFRLVPVAVFLVVPFMEFLLPVALKLFPNMLPSTFETKLQREEALKRRVQAKLEVARFLQDTVAEMAKDMTTSAAAGDASRASAADLYAFMKRVRAGEPVSATDVTRFAALFKDELTLDNLDRAQLVSLCRFAGIQPFGTDAFLAARLRAHLARIKSDDRAIREEGVASLTDDELRSACRARGMRAPFGDGARAFNERQLTDWLDLSLNHALPSSLLLLSRAFAVTAPLTRVPAAPQAAAAPTTPTTTAPPSTVDRLRETLGVLPDEAIEAVSLEAPLEAGGGAAELERKLESLRREEELIAEEAKEAAAAAAAAQADEAAAAQAAAACAVDSGDAAARRLTPLEHASPAAAVAASAAAAVVREAAASAEAAALTPDASSATPRHDIDFVGGESAEERAARAAAAKEERMRRVLRALAALASTSGVSAERSEFMGLVRTEIDRLNAELAARGASSLVFFGGAAQVERPAELTKALGAERLAGRVPAILARIEAELDTVDARIGEKMHVLDADNDGIVSEVRAGFGGGGEEMNEHSSKHTTTRPANIAINLPLTPKFPPFAPHTQAELTTALGFLKEQLGEDELRNLLERLEDMRVAAAADASAAAAADTPDASPPSPDGKAIDVAKLMALAEAGRAEAAREE